nr:hypothetical protein [uncultured Rhodopila sp.]
MPTPAMLRPSPFLHRLVVYLLPYFMAVTSDRAKAEAEILETLASYGARTRAELVKAVQIIAFSFSALEVLAEAQVDEDMPPPLRLRYLGCANALNRHSETSEKTLEKRLKCDLPERVIPTAEPDADPVDDLTEAEAEVSLQQARDAITAYRNSLPAARPAAPPQAIGAYPPGRPGGPVMQAMFEGGMPANALATRAPAAPETQARAATAIPA